MIIDKNKRIEVMREIGEKHQAEITEFLNPIEKNWQPADLLPDVNSADFEEQVKELQELAMQMDEDLFITLIGDTITEEALPTYESWLMDVVGIDQHDKNVWSKWIRGWTAEENRHGDALNTYLYLCGRVNMREMQITTQYLISDGFDIMTAQDPYRNFIYTSFQELATNVSHRRVASLARKTGNDLIAKMCGMIAADEARHAGAYKKFIGLIMELDPNEVMIAFADMMKKKIIMPAQYIRESGQQIGELFETFSDAAQRANVYTAHDYIEILISLLKYWKIEDVRELDSAGEKARDYLMKLPSRLERITQRMKIPEKSHQFKWVLK